MQLWTDMVPIFLLLRGLWIQGANAETFYYMVPVTPITIVDMVPITPIRRLLLQMSLPHHSFYFLYARTQSKFQAFICNHYLALSIIICEQYHLNVTNMISQYLKSTFLWWQFNAMRMIVHEIWMNSQSMEFNHVKVSLIKWKVHYW